MTLEEIKTAVEAGKHVCWKHAGYQVVKDSRGEWYILCTSNDNAIGLTWRDGITMSGRPDDFKVLP